jgi:hypothetical protein
MVVPFFRDPAMYVVVAPESPEHTCVVYDQRCWWAGHTRVSVFVVTGEVI